MQLDDDTHIPVELRAGYRLLGNAGYLPPELLLRQEALLLSNLLNNIEQTDARYTSLSKKLFLLELKLQQAGIDTAFLYHDCYRQKILEHLDNQK